jgi:DNA-binding transcriptional LysR family regulator
LRSQFDDLMMARVSGKMQPTAQALLLVSKLRPVLRGLRRALEPVEPFEPATTDRVFRIVHLAAPSVMAKLTAAIREAAPDAMIDWFRINPTNQNDLVDGLIDLLQVSGPVHLVDGIESVDLAPITVFTFARKGHS